MNRGKSLLKGYPRLSALVKRLDAFLQKSHPEFFGKAAIHPVLPVKQKKVIHDNVWGTVRFTWPELALLDTPLLQRLRHIHQVGLAYHIYPSARHSRLEHSLGVLMIASRVFDSLIERNRGLINDVIKNLAADRDEALLQLKQEVRLAALLHDTGHSLFSHASEKVYSELELLKEAQSELTRIVGKQKGAGEVLSFCLTLTDSVRGVLDRAKAKRAGENLSDALSGTIDLNNVALMIVGRSSHPYLQFLGDVISSDFDADKLDYLIRDATAAGLPLRYDLDMYLNTVALEQNVLADGEGELQRLYASSGAKDVDRRAKNPRCEHPHYETYRLRLPKRAMHVIEQVVICKLMLFSYMYHHPKVRAAEGLLERMLRRVVKRWRRSNSEQEIVEKFLSMTDASLVELAERHGDALVRNTAYRLINRLLPREIYRLSSSQATHAERAPVTDYLTKLQDKRKGARHCADLERAIGEELRKSAAFTGKTAEEALAVAGMWVDVPKGPKFEDVEDLIVGGDGGSQGIVLGRLFPIGEWQHAYTNYRYYVRIYAYSEYVEIAKGAAKQAMKRMMNIESEEFYRRAERVRA